VLLQHRATWSHEGGTWAVPGGARNRSESAVAAALRESVEEAGVPPELVRPLGELTVDHGPWSYTTVLAEPAATLPVAARAESIELRWVPTGEVAQLDLHAGFASAWPLLRAAAGRRLRVIVDVANVMGSRPDGWWHDRAAAAARLRDQVEAAFGTPLPAADLPAGCALPGLTGWHPELLLVVEGKAREIAQRPGASTVVRSEYGDDSVVEAAAAAPRGSTVLVVTADRDLARRCADLGAVVTGPRWVLDLVDRST
jgi:ADP-ribose pyrophosphatase YjhB (NUDIX family)